MEQKAIFHHFPDKTAGRGLTQVQQFFYIAAQNT
jgi:hypothetical protein